MFYHLNFDLMILKYNQFIGSAKYIHRTCSKFDSNPSVSIDNAFTSYFYTHNEPYDL